MSYLLSVLGPLESQRVCDPCSKKEQGMSPPRLAMLMQEVGLQTGDLRHFPLSSCLFIPTLSTIMGTSTEYSVSGGIGTGRYLPGGVGGLAPHLVPGVSSQVASVTGFNLVSTEIMSFPWVLSIYR
jgi:hypothetical protein